ncbi:lipoprotein [Caballeronia peredens]|nr:lipoprotein [Caballeronia peredens]
MTRSIGRRGARLLLGALGALLAASALAQSATPVGTWQTIDDKTGKPKAVIQIVDDGGQLSGKVVRGIGEFDQPERRCTACTDERKDQLVKGMTIITGMRQDGDGWDGGQILDPENGKLYKCKMKLEDGGQKLVVRGYIGVSLLGRSQTWVRQP